MSNRTEREVSIDATKQVARTALVLVAVLTLAVGGAVAQENCAEADDVDCEDELKSQINQIGQFLSIVIAAVAIPNGAFGVFQWMTAGIDTEQSDKGRKRIRNSFIGAAGAGVVMVAVRLLNTMI